MSRRNKSSDTPKVTQHRNVGRGFRNLMGKAGNASAPDHQKPSRWRRSNVYQKIDLVAGGLALTASVGYALCTLGHHVAFLGTVSAFLSPYASVLLSVMLIGACVMLLSAAIQTWRNSQRAAEEEMSNFEERAGVPHAEPELIETEPASGGAVFNPHLSEAPGV